jgi:FlaA1/EpsC-like NDP-sugar epimerase
MRKKLYRFRRPIIALIHAVLVATALLIAYLLRFDYAIPKAEVLNFYRALWLAVPLKVVVFWITGLDRTWSRFVGIADLYSTLLANAAATVCFVLAALLLYGTQFSRSVYGIDFLFCFLSIGFARVSYRLYTEVLAQGGRKKSAKRILIYGAGNAGATLLRELRMNPSLGYRAIGFIDDNPMKIHTSIMNVPVLACGRETARLCASYERKHMRIDEIIIAMPSATGNEMHEALANCRGANVPCKTIPGVGELLAGKVLSSQIREVSVLDLLGRDPVHLDETSTRRAIEGRTIMVTGAAGSIGAELCRQIARFSPQRLVAFEQAESDLYRVHNELTYRYRSIEIIPQIGDIRDPAGVDAAIRKFEVDGIFHAAAYKHVPLMEGHVIEAVRNNILGTRNLMYAAQRNALRDFLMISTDKAVNPTNVMGATKRVAELLVTSLPAGTRSPTKCVSVRFGNVLGSNGSVIPLFREQIEAGGPVTVTHPEMRRYFMTIPEAAQLVLQAFHLGKGSEIFVLDMGEPVKIVDLAKNMIRLSGKEPGVDVEIRFTGLRPGEKLFEELVLEGEDVMATPHPKIKVFRGKRMLRTDMDEWLREMEAYVRQRDEDRIIDHIQQIVPEYRTSRQRANDTYPKTLTASQAS